MPDLRRPFSVESRRLMASSPPFVAAACSVVELRNLRRGLSWCDPAHQGRGTEHAALQIVRTVLREAAPALLRLDASTPMFGSTRQHALFSQPGVVIGSDVRHAFKAASAHSRTQPPHADHASHAAKRLRLENAHPHESCLCTSVCVEV